MFTTMKLHHTRVKDAGQCFALRAPAALINNKNGKTITECIARVERGSRSLMQFHVIEIVYKSNKQTNKIGWTINYAVSRICTSKCCFIVCMCIMVVGASVLNARAKVINFSTLQPQNQHTTFANKSKRTKIAAAYSGKNPFSSQTTTKCGHYYTGWRYTDV